MTSTPTPHKAARLYWLAFAALLFAAGCDTLPEGRARDLEGHAIGWQNWKVIGAEGARLHLAGDTSSVRLREAATVPSRYQERWTVDNGHLHFEALNDGGFGAESGAPTFLTALYANDPGLLERGVRLEALNVRRDGTLLYAGGLSPSYACVVFAVVFGDQTFEGSLGDRLLRGGLCARRRATTPITLEAQMRNLLARLDADGLAVLGSQAAATAR